MPIKEAKVLMAGTIAVSAGTAAVFNTETTYKPESQDVFELIRLNYYKDLLALERIRKKARKAGRLR
ncbi:MAG: hypothetical protein ABSF44_02515 [Candidatus Bathyarchaeia archaeon]|jgi:hypothetical protein